MNEYWNNQTKKMVTVSKENPLPVAIAGGIEPEPGSVTTESIADGAVTSAKIADGAITDDKLATPKIDKPDPLVPSKVIGTTLESSNLGLVNYSQTPFADSLAMYQFGGQLAVGDPQGGSDATTKEYVDGQVAARIAKSAIASIEPIDDPSTATVEDVANAFNALLSALKG